jgi:hypothetical protein
VLLFPQKINHKEIALFSEYKHSEGKTFEHKYHIIINNDGTVYDCSLKNVYDSFMLWAKSTSNDMKY